MASGAPSELRIALIRKRAAKSGRGLTAAMLRERKRIAPLYNELRGIPGALVDTVYKHVQFWLVDETRGFIHVPQKTRCVVIQQMTGTVRRGVRPKNDTACLITMDEIRVPQGLTTGLIRYQIHSHTGDCFVRVEATQQLRPWLAGTIQ